MTTQIKLEKIGLGKSAWRPPRGVPGAVFWLACSFCLLWALRLIPGAVGSFFAVLQVLVGLAFLGLAGVLVLRFVRQRMLWSLRSKLVLTYLLIGLAPVVLFVTLVTISAYIAAGQFAIHLADTRLQAELNQMASDNGHLTGMMKRFVEANPGQVPPRGAEPGAVSDIRLVHRETRAFIDGAPLMQEDRAVKTPFGLPPWAADLKGESFQGLVLDNGELFLVAIHQERLKDGRLFSAMTSLPVDAAVMGGIADGLGRVGLLRRRAGASPGVEAQNDLTAPRSQAQVANQPAARSWVYGGGEPPSAGLSDIRVRFVSTTSITDWDTDEADNALIEVDSRPSLLYRQLFGASLGGVVTSGIRIGLISLCVAFALLELLALVLAIRLSQTITASVADLYEATQKIDRGELDHLIPVNRDDQLAELSKSFNRMTGSLQRLLLEQQEKERLQNELSIAQEVQANLFPRQDCDLSTLQLHGVCRPARSVSGDYYDFLVFHEEGVGGRTARRDTGVGIALGDISGKGISAALLMATLHSAVRAYRFASEELVYSESQVDGLTASRDGNGGLSGELFESPGRILSLLNRHLYRSTQPEKYATLFLAHYDADSSMMTYSNGGQLPPLVLGQDGSVRRLDKGGTVVGLMDGMSYEEDRFKMQPGDIMVAYSDGVTEPENDFGEFGEEQMMEVIRLYRDQPLHVISSQVMQALDAWIGAEEQPDDITLVLARQL
jgi:sigma-B regulation protein RsbU (phosphoserine phosphatase)